MATLTKAQKDEMIREVGIARINTEGATKVAGGTYLLPTDIEGRFVEIKVTAKSDKFTQEDLDAMLMERAIIEQGKLDRASASAKKKARDAEKRTKAKDAEKSAEVAE